MRSTGRKMSVLTATALSMALLQLFVLTRDGVEARSMRIAFLMTRPPSKTVIRQTSFGVRNTILDLRGGDDASSAAALEVEIDVDDIESSDEEEEEEEEEPKLDPKLARSAQSAVSKAKARAAKAAVNASKASVASALKSKTEKKKSNSGLFQIPYIVKACLNPFVFMQMTAGYWKSLFNYKFADTLKDSSQDLRNSLQDKAKKGGGGSSSRKKRKMKPGQAKTLSDLPQLNT